MTRPGRLAIAVTVATLLFSATAFAEGWGGPGGHRGGGGGAFGWPVLRAVGLDDAQKAQIRQIFTTHRPQLQSLRQQLMTAQGQVRDKLLSPTPPTAADIVPINQLRDQLAQERLAMALEIRNVLTPDQLAKAAQIRQQMKQLRQQMRDLTKPPTS